MRDFAAIDFETANGRRSSVCSVGIVFVKDGKIADSFYSLIKPYPNYYSDFTTRIHGLTKVDTDVEDTFPEVWSRIEERLKGLPLVAHNKPFDEGCLKAVFEAYKLPYPGYEFYCTLAASRRCLSLPNHRLNTVSYACGFNLANHHHALADAEAAAHIGIHICNRFGEEMLFRDLPKRPMWRLRY